MAAERNPGARQRWPSPLRFRRTQFVSALTEKLFCPNPQCPRSFGEFVSAHTETPPLGLHWLSTGSSAIVTDGGFVRARQRFPGMDKKVQLQQRRERLRLTLSW